MEILESQRAISTQKPSKRFSTEVPADYSRQKAMQLLESESDVRNSEVYAVPAKTATAELYKLFMKIGGTNELPKEKSLRTSFLNDFWRTLYLRNHLCPGDIPFSIIIDEFTVALVQGVVDRKGNNQAAICKVFNEWISRDDVRHRLYEIRNRMYGAPKQIPKHATEKTIADYSDEEIQQKLASIKPMAGLKMVDQMIAELEAEVGRRENGKKRI